MRTVTERKLKRQLTASHRALAHAEARIRFLNQEIEQRNRDLKALNSAFNTRQQEQMVSSRENMAKALGQLMESVAKAITVVIAKEQM